jgi:hypothetical protein
MVNQVKRRVLSGDFLHQGQALHLQRRQLRCQGLLQHQPRCLVLVDVVVVVVVFVG